MLKKEKFVVWVSHMNWTQGELDLESVIIHQSHRSVFRFYPQFAVTHDDSWYSQVSRWRQCCMSSTASEKGVKREVKAKEEESHHWTECFLTNRLPMCVPQSGGSAEATGLACAATLLTQLKTPWCGSPFQTTTNKPFPDWRNRYKF